jgi:hypothetical protein
MDTYGKVIGLPSRADVQSWLAIVAGLSMMMKMYRNKNIEILIVALLLGVVYGLFSFVLFAKQSSFLTRFFVQSGMLDFVRQNSGGVNVNGRTIRAREVDRSHTYIVVSVLSA